MRGAPSRSHSPTRIAVISVLLLMMIFCIDSSSGSTNASWSWSNRPWILGGWKKVLIAEVPTLHFKESVMTTGRNPGPQLRCIGGTARCRLRMTEAECQNGGSFETGVSFECSHTYLVDGKGWKSGSGGGIHCESGYGQDYRYVIEGSCWFEYEVDLTFLGMWRLLTVSYYEGPWTTDEVQKLIYHLILPFVVVVSVVFALVFVLYKMYLKRFFAGEE